ncbi:MAG: hypothetical protein EOP06_11365 [Proteobacteria bacterium]|nr:MAG: hypothetical protein EOP06_11365 [Pseudomonadota bacterium]
MTDQGVQALIARFERVWGTGIQWQGQECSLQLGNSTIFSSTAHERYRLFFLIMPGLSLCAGTVGNFSIQRAAWCSLEEYQVLLKQWLPFFRRGCWLSGCPIEASTHEKAEWTQGFSREDLEAWQLKL